MVYTSESMEKIVEMFSTLPTIGRKTAQRLAFHIIRQNEDFVNQFAKALLNLKKNIKYCSICYNYTESDPCPICSSAKRNSTVICVVEEPNDVTAIEKTGGFDGLYHVLHGVLNPLDGVSQDDIRIKELVNRITEVDEVILALNPSLEGDVTTQYIAKILKQIGLKVTRIARGLPVGSDLEFADDATISRAIEGRIEI